MSHFTILEQASLASKFALISLAMAHLPVSALNLSQALELARHSDPSYLSAHVNRTGMRERQIQSEAALLPQVSISASGNATRRKYITRDSPFPPAFDTYDSNNVQLTINQPIWRSSNRAAVTQARATVAQADFQLLAAEQDLLVRLMQGWFDWMLARDAVLAAQSQVVATEFQMKLTERAQSTGLASDLNLQEASMKYQQAHSDWLSAQTDQSVKLANLEQIIGPIGESPVPALSDQYMPPDPRSDKLEVWLARADAENPPVQAARRALQAAREEIRKQQAGHEPTLDFVATLGRNQQAAGSFPGQNGSDQRSRSFGLQLNIPLYAGGAVSSKVREAIAARDKAEQDVEAARRTARFNATQAWNVWLASHTRESAAQQGVKFWTSSLKAANTGQASGLKSGMDVVQASGQLYSALRDLQKTRYDKITSYLKLKAVVGQLQDQDLIEFDRWFGPARELPSNLSEFVPPREKSGG